MLDAADKNVLASTTSPPVLDAQEPAAADDLNVEAGFMPADQKPKSHDGIFTNEYVSGTSEYVKGK